MEDWKKESDGHPQEPEKQEPELLATWAEDALADLEDFIEEQGIYVRQ